MWMGRRVIRDFTTSRRAVRLGPLRRCTADRSVPGLCPGWRINSRAASRLPGDLDDKLKTPYSHVIDFSITRELPSNFVFEASYVGRFAHRLMQEEDLAEPTNLKDPESNTTYFQAAQALAKQYYAGTPIQKISAASIGTKYWENVFPAAAGPPYQLFGTSSELPGPHSLALKRVANYERCYGYTGNVRSVLQFLRQ